MPSEKFSISIQGMTCNHCVRAITDALKSVDGVEDVDVSLAEKKATIVADRSRAKDEDLQAVIEAEGYAARM